MINQCKLFVIIIIFSIIIIVITHSLGQFHMRKEKITIFEINYSGILSA